MSTDRYRAPDSAHAWADIELDGAPGHLQDLFAARLDRWWHDLDEGLRAIYPDTVAEELTDDLVRLAAQAFLERSDDLHALDLRRTLRPQWFQGEDVLGYAAYADRFADDLKGVGTRIDYLRELGVTYLHLMPLLRPRDGDNDGGYAVSDYFAVRPDLGSVDDLRDLATALRENGISLVLDLVLNHVAREHEWAAAARLGDQRFRAYFHTLGHKAEVDAWERTLPQVFPDTAPGNFTWDEELQSWVWTTFESYQWDVNWGNPEVFLSYAEIVLFLANLGVEVLRLDAIAFLWKRKGTSCQNQPEVHAITQALRAITRIAAPALVFQAEAIVGPADLVAYLGRGTHHGRVSDLAYHNSLMVQVWSMLASRDVRLAAQALRALPPIPSSTAWITYVRCHDDIGWAIDDADAAAVGLNGPWHRSFLSDFYAGEFPGSEASGAVFQANAATGDRRISGMSSALAGLGRSPDGTVVARVLLAHAVVLGWGGVPVIWMGDEIALPNDDDWAGEPGHGEDNRWLHRPRMDWERAERRVDPDTVPGQVHAGLRRLVTARASLPHLDASVAAEIPDLADPGILPVLRRHPVGALLELYNVTESWRAWPAHRLLDLQLEHPRDAITGRRVEPAEDGNLWLAPYEALWLVTV